ncbi:hypothetical protein [Mycoplasma tauri]|uniref:Uncharacterized protein n=1 Tax=Mycoplasma tauri TaxID=547987 RepID=A0A953NGH3_9MOLU|nr:hypothetical protein [Mycoplasma tauri]MBZ4195251.1 hypothetical protein [Mycoplasma tauri]MBZ4203648.1 hypothetical protein [Mycoplasma tauri]MBZ4204186.1 hypothetical protein [Mycoplasma tauri]MBZ4212584.1 hypothetical protein [Mycoplasma tauri]MBZ4218216.1 hypothetical protein [Mycoplasma tauri]
MTEENKKNENTEDSAPAVVGQIKVSNELFDVSTLIKKSSKKENTLSSKDDEKLTPRERAIKARREGK